MYRARLSQIQAFSEGFNGFTEEELDALYPFFAIVEFDDTDYIAQEGEDASWVGILLSGEVHAIKAGNVLMALGPGKVIGEMSLFHGGKRMADLKANGPGVVAALLFADAPALYEQCPIVGHKLFLAFSRAATKKIIPVMEAPQRSMTRMRRRSSVSGLAAASPTALRKASMLKEAGNAGTMAAAATAAFAAASPPPGGRSASSGGEPPQSPSRKYKAAAERLVKKGLTKGEVATFLNYLTITEFEPQQELFIRDRFLLHFGVVLVGAVDMGGDQGEAGIRQAGLIAPRTLTAAHTLTAAALTPSNRTCCRRAHLHPSSRQRSLAGTPPDVWTGS
eukprot:3726131-Prymnesium_polylepis.1